MLQGWLWSWISEGMDSPLLTLGEKGGVKGYSWEMGADGLDSVL